MPLIDLFEVSWKQEKERIKIQALFCLPVVILCKCIRNLFSMLACACLLAGCQLAVPTRVCYFDCLAGGTGC